MFGGLITLAMAAIVDLLIHRRAASLRNLFFLLMSGASFVLLSGLPEYLFPELPALAFLTLKSGLAPLSGALALACLWQWLGESAEDRIVYYAIVWGSTALILSALIMAILVVTAPGHLAHELVLASVLINVLAVLLTTATVLRAAHLGDTLGRELVLPCLFLSLAVAGLNGREVVHQATGPLIWSLTALCTIVFFLTLVNLGIRHSHRNRKLERLAGMSQENDGATGLPQGSVLLSKVDDAFWRSARLNTQCTVICLHLRNLFELSEFAGHSVDEQFLSSMTARIRRAVGFRCVVGLYHPRCFVIVISAVKQTRVSEQLLNRLRIVMNKPLTVTGWRAENHVFQPQFSIGALTVTANTSNPAQVIDEAERLAQQALEDDELSECTTGY